MLQCLGRGGFGEVYRARMARGDRFHVDVAIKLLRADIDPQGQAAARLRDEARLLARLRHRAIPRLIDLIQLEGRVALVSELIEGADLDDCLALEPPPGRRMLLETLAEVADALDAASRVVADDGTPRPIVHRDLKPANLRVSREGVVKVLDFGIAWTPGELREADTQTGALIGSPPYMSPERFAGRPPTPAADVYGLGCVLAECLTGVRLWGDLALPAMAALSVERRRFEGALQARLGEELAALPAALADSLRACLAWRPEDRPSAAALAATWSALAAGCDGPGLAAWCREAAWSAAPTAWGPLVGRTLTEGGPVLRIRSATENAPLPGMTPPWRDRAPVTSQEPPEVRAEALTGDLPSAAIQRGWEQDGDGPATPGASPPTMPFAMEAPVEAPKRGLVWWPFGLALLLLVILGQWTRPLQPDGLSSDPSPMVPPPAAPHPEVAPVEHGAPEVTAAPALAPSQVEAASRPSPAARPVPPGPVAATTLPRAVVAEPVPTAPPAPAKVLISVDAASAATVPRLHDGRRSWLLPAEVPPGHYEILAEFTPGVPQTFGAIDVQQGRPQTVSCVHRNCRAR